jgi:palmitoyltransferase
MQVGSWLVYVLDVVTYYTLIIPILSSTVRWIMGILLGLLFMTMALTGYIATKCDPSDPNIAFEKKMKEGNPAYVSHLKFYCAICQAHVHENTKHCGECNRCVLQFDHHCKWLNNCVGGLNYRTFCVLIGAGLTTVIVRIALLIYIIVFFITDHDVYATHIGEFYGVNGNPSIIFYVLMAVSLKEPFILFLFTDLVFFHAWLWHKKITTYQYITMKRDVEFYEQVFYRLFVLSKH